MQQATAVVPAILSKHGKLTIMTICDMIKGNESDVGNIDFELQA